MLRAFRNVALMFLALTNQAFAEPAVSLPSEGERHHITFKAPATCATAEVFNEEVRRRTPRLRLSELGPWQARFDIEVRDDGSHFVGAVTVHGVVQSSERREVTAKSCEEVLETLALIVAVAVDPNASLSKPPAAPRSEPTPVLAKSRAEPPAPPPERESPPAAEAGPARPATLHQALALGVEARSAFASDAALAGRLGFSLERHLPDDWGWALRLSALHSLESEVVDPFGRTARFTWTAGRLEGGLVLFAARGQASLEAGLGLDAGAVRAEVALSETRPWMSVLGLLRGRWIPFAPFAIEGTFGAFAPLIRDRFVLYDPGTVVYRERALAGLVALDLSVRLH